MSSSSDSIDAVSENTAPQTIEDVIKSLVGFSQVVSKSVCALQDAVNNLTTTVEEQAKEIAQLRKMFKSTTDSGSADDMRMNSDPRNPAEIDESEEECVSLLNKMQMRRDALKNTPHIESELVNLSECKKESRAISNAKSSILAAAKHLAATNP
jgi:hypothetical protein